MNGCDKRQLRVEWRALSSSVRPAIAPLLGQPTWPHHPVRCSPHVAPTSFGNRLSAMESYGVETYGLDSQNLWYELIDVSSEPTTAAIEAAKERTDAMVADVDPVLVDGSGRSGL